MSNSSRPHGLKSTKLLHPWDSPGKSTEVGCHCLLWWLLLCLKCSHHFQLLHSPLMRVPHRLLGPCGQGSRAGLKDFISRQCPAPVQPRSAILRFQGLRVDFSSPFRPKTERRFHSRWLNIGALSIVLCSCDSWMAQTCLGAFIRQAQPMEIFWALSTHFGTKERSMRGWPSSPGRWCFCVGRGRGF